jgi:predicted transcriptional regulator
MKKVRLNVYMSADLKNRIEVMAKKLGRSKTDMAALAIGAGLDLLELSTSEKFASIVAQNPEFIAELQGVAYQAMYSEGEGSGSDEHSMDGRQDNP